MSEHLERVAAVLREHEQSYGTAPEEDDEGLLEWAKAAVEAWVGDRTLYELDAERRCGYESKWHNPSCFEGLLTQAIHEVVVSDE